VTRTNGLRIARNRQASALTLLVPSSSDRNPEILRSSETSIKIRHRHGVTYHKTGINNGFTRFKLQVNLRNYSVKCRISSKRDGRLANQKNSQLITEPRSSLPCSQQPAKGLYPKSHRSSPHPQKHPTLILSCNLR
jgi:hypothetical protein